LLKNFLIKEDTKRAIQENPEYWIRWYTFKSLALVGAIGFIGFLVGRNYKKR
jgi:hypothetical protein